ncbi:MAG: hypothetical protein ABIT69_06270 [Sphingomicrobium sp.]
MPMIVGVALAVAVALYAHVVGLDRERGFYPVVLVVVAHYYDLFAVVGGRAALGAETIPFVLFAGAAAVGFRTSLWVVVAGLAGHGLFDVFHHRLIANPGVPAWWPAFCLSFDVAAALCLAAVLAKGERPLPPGPRAA